MPDVARVSRLLAERRPGFSLPQALYTDPDVYEVERLAFFARSWVFVAFEVELPEPGCSYATSIAGAPIVLVRGRDRQVRGFFNVCRHRGAQICAEVKARSPRLVCPYHQWAYDLEGRLAHAGRMQDDFDPADYGLLPVRVELAAGAIFVCTGEDPPEFEAFRAAFQKLAPSHDFSQLKVVREQVILEKANWKLAMENSRECYHCGVGHPELCLTYYDSTMLDFETSDDPFAHAFKAGLEARGLDCGPYDGDWWSVSRYPLNPGTASQTVDGRAACKKLIGPADSGVLRWITQAHSYNYAMPDYIFTFSVLPTGPLETVLHSKWLVHKDAVEGVDYDLDHLTKVWWVTNEQDVWLTENNQKGVGSAGYRPGPYAGATEAALMRFIDHYCEVTGDHCRRELARGRPQPVAA